MIVDHVRLEPFDALESPFAEGTNLGVVAEVAVVGVVGVDAVRWIRQVVARVGIDVSRLFRLRRVLVNAVRVLLVHFQEVLAAQFLLTDIARNSSYSATGCCLSGMFINIYAVHFKHMSLHKVFVAQFFIADVAIVATS